MAGGVCGSRESVEINIWEIIGVLRGNEDALPDTLS